MSPAVKPFNGILEDQVKAIPVQVGKENRITGITAKDNVVHGRWKMYAGFTCHAGSLTTNIQKSSLTPKVFPKVKPDPKGVPKVKPDPKGVPQDIPVPVRETCMCAQGLRPRGVRIPLAVTRYPMLPSASLDASAPRRRVFSRLNTWPTCPLSTLRRRPYGRIRMTRGRCGSLFLHRMGLSPTISRRF